MMVLGNVTRSVMQRYQDFAAVHFPYSLYIAAGLMVLRPDANVFANMYRIWSQGDYPYYPPSELKHRFTYKHKDDDDQRFLATLFFKPPWQRKMP